MPFKKANKNHFKKAKDVIAKQRQTLQEAPGDRVGSNEEEGFGGKIKLNCKDEKLWCILLKEAKDVTIS